MTISTSINRVTQTGNGATTVWNYGFLIPDPTEVVVQITDKTTGVVTTLNSGQYVITGIGSASGGTVTYTPALTTNQTITIQRILTLVQNTSLSNQGAFYPAVVETALDYLTMICQQLNDATGRALVVSAQGASTIDAQTNRIINVVNGLNPQDAVTLAQLQAQFAANGNVPLPTLGQVGQYLKATGTGLFAWAVNQVTSANITDSTSTGRSVLTAADVPTAQANIGLYNPLMFRNRIINGHMEIDQRAEGAVFAFSGTGSNIYAGIDRWYYNVTQASKVSAQRISTNALGTIPFNYALNLVSQSAYTPLTSDFFIIGQNIEAAHFEDWMYGTSAAKTTTLSFWAYCSVTGTFSGALRNNGNTRSYPFTYTISSANTWTKISITIPGDTTGTWPSNTTNLGVGLVFDLGSGSTFRGTAGAWSGNNYVGATGAVSLVATNAANLAITGVQWELGSVATPFELRHPGLELALCQRYFEKSYDPGTAVGAASASGLGMWLYVNSGTGAPAQGGMTAFYKVTKRGSPSVTYYSAVTGVSGKFRDYVANADVNAGPFVAGLTCHTASATMSASSTIHLGAHWTAACEI